MKKNTTYWIIGIAIVFLVVANSQSRDEMVGLTPHYYQDGVEVFPQKSFFSIVTPPGGSYDQISFDVSVTNTGDVPINTYIFGASPLEFLNALPTTTQTLAIEETKTLWTSDLIDTVQFESISPVNFWIKISGTDPLLGTIYEEAYSGEISFESESQTATQAFFSSFFSMVDFGGQTYYYDQGEIQGGTNNLVEFTGSGYLTGIHTSGRSPITCQIDIDGSQYFYETSTTSRTTAGYVYIISNSNTVRFENSLQISCIAPSANFHGSYHISYMTA